MKEFLIIPALIVTLGACSTAPGSGNGSGGAGEVTIAQFNIDGKFEASSYELGSLGWEVTQPAAPAWVGLTDADPAPDKTPGAGSKIMKLDFSDTANPAVQYSTRGFTMQRKLNISEAGTYTFRFKYKGKNFDGAVKAAFDGDEKIIPTGDWGGSEGWEWNSADGAPNPGDYERFNGPNISSTDFTLEAKTYTVKFSITGTYTAGEWGYIDGFEIIKKTLVPPATTSKTLAEFKTMGSFEGTFFTLAEAGWTVENQGGSGLFLDDSGDVISGTRSMKLYSDDESLDAVAGFVMSTKITIPTPGDYLVNFKLRGKTWYYTTAGGGAIKLTMDSTIKTAGLSGNEVWKPNAETVSTEFTALAAGEYTFKLSVDSATDNAAFGRLDDLEIVKK